MCVSIYHCTSLRFGTNFFRRFLQKTFTNEIRNNSDLFTQLTDVNNLEEHFAHWSRCACNLRWNQAAYIFNVFFSCNGQGFYDDRKWICASLCLISKRPLATGSYAQRYPQYWSWRIAASAWHYLFTSEACLSFKRSPFQHYIQIKIICSFFVY